jgi:hypothetical protein
MARAFLKFLVREYWKENSPGFMTAMAAMFMLAGSIAGMALAVPALTILAEPGKGLVAQRTRSTEPTARGWVQVVLPTGLAIGAAILLGDAARRYRNREIRKARTHIREARRARMPRGRWESGRTPGGAPYRKARLHGAAACIFPRSDLPLCRAVVVRGETVRTASHLRPERAPAWAERQAASILKAGRDARLREDRRRAGERRTRERTARLVEHATAPGAGE